MNAKQTRYSVLINGELDAVARKYLAKHGGTVSELGRIALAAYLGVPELGEMASPGRPWPEKASKNQGGK